MIRVLVSIFIAYLFIGCSHRFETSGGRYWFWDDETFDERLDTIFPNMAARDKIIVDDLELVEVDFAEIEGWSRDNQSGSFEAFLRGCEKSRSINIPAICEEAKNLNRSRPSKKEVKKFFEQNFSPYVMIDRDGYKTAGLVTGYYVPLLKGSRKKTSKYKYPIYAKPRDFKSPYLTHREIDKGKIPADVICWVDDRVDRFFLHIQGSGMVEFEDGSRIGIGYADKNGYSYTSIGRYIHKKYDVPLHKLSAGFIKNWLKKHSDRADEVLYSNESFVFFREQGHGEAYGSMGTNLVPKSTIAVDTKHIPQGVPIYIQNINGQKHEALNHLFMAQDRGGAIKGVIRADLFFGFGAEAGKSAGTMKRDAQFYMLIPHGYNFEKED
jgi:membrane-bound lytic murein transglycosylase A